MVEIRNPVSMNFFTDKRTSHDINSLPVVFFLLTESQIRPFFIFADVNRKAVFGKLMYHPVLSEPGIHLSKSFFCLSHGAESEI